MLSTGAVASWLAFGLWFLGRRRTAIEVFLFAVIGTLVAATLVRSLVFPPDLALARDIANLERYLLVATPLSALILRRWWRR